MAHQRQKKRGRSLHFLPLLYGATTRRARGWTRDAGAPRGFTPEEAGNPCQPASNAGFVEGGIPGRKLPHPSKLANAAGIPHDVVRWRKVKASQVGGEAAKQRLIRGGWERYREADKHHTESEARRDAAKVGYLTARSKSKASGCKVGIFGRYGTQHDRRYDRISYGDQ